MGFVLCVTLPDSDSGVPACSLAPTETGEATFVFGARTKLERYRGTTDLPDVEGKRVVVVDGGIATGATTLGRSVN